MTIIELAYKDAYIKKNTVNWTNILKTPIVVKPQQTIGVKMAIINNLENTTFQTINIPDDIIISMTCGFYINSLNNSIMNGNKDFVLPYNYLYAYDGSNLITSNKTYTIPAGKYTPDEIATLITRSMSALYNPTSLLPYDIARYYLENRTRNFFRPSQIAPILIDISNGVLPGQDEITVETSEYSKYSSYFAVGKAIRVFWGSLQSSGEQTILQITQPTPDITKIKTMFIFPDNKLPDGTQKPWTDVFITTDVNKFPDQVIGDLTNFHDDNLNSTLLVSKNLWIGANNISLTYNYENSNRFQFQYLHTPLYDPNGNECILAIFGSTPGVFRYADNQSGVFFTDLQPREFWESTLGFNLDNILVKLVDVPGGLKKLQPPLIPGQTITSNYVSYGDLMINKDNITIPVGANNDVQKVYQQSNITTTIKGSNYLNTRTSKFYYLNIKANYFNDITNQNEKMPFLSGIITQQYNDQGTTYVFNDSCFNYTHQGDPITLSSFEVEILNEDGLTDANLGLDNIIFLEID